MVRNKLHPMTPFQMSLPPLRTMWGFIFCVSKFMSFHHLPFNLFVGGLTSCYWLMVAFVPWLMWSLLISPKHVWFHMLFHLMMWWWWFKLRNFFYHNWHSTYVFFPLAIKVFWCLHQQVDDVFHQCANMAWLRKDINGPPLVFYVSAIGRECQ